MAVAHAARRRRLLVVGLGAALLVPLSTGPAGAQVPASAERRGRTRGYSRRRQAGPRLRRPHPGNRSAEGHRAQALTWIKPAHGAAVRVPTDQVGHLPAGATVSLTLGGAVTDAASSQGRTPGRPEGAGLLRGGARDDPRPGGDVHDRHARGQRGHRREGAPGRRSEHGPERPHPGHDGLDHGEHADQPAERRGLHLLAGPDPGRGDAERRPELAGDSLGHLRLRLRRPGVHVRGHQDAVGLAVWRGQAPDDVHRQRPRPSSARTASERSRRRTTAWATVRT